MTLILPEAPPAPVAATPPAWVGAPDIEGNCTGFTAEFEGLDLSVVTSWSAKDGPEMWMDAVIYESRNISPAQARKIALALLTAADLVESAL